MTRLGRARYVLRVVAAIWPVVAGSIGCGPQQPVTVRVLTYNIHHGLGVDGRGDLERIAAVIRR